MRRLELVKKQIEEYQNFQSNFKSKDDKFKRLLGVDQEELESEALLLESSLGKKEKTSDDKQQQKKVDPFYKDSTDEKNRKKNILNRLKISDVSNTAHLPTRKLFFDSSISKNQNLMKALDNFDVNKKTQTTNNQIFMFRKKNTSTE